MDKGTIVRTGVLLLALVNTVLQLFGVEVLPFTPDDVELALTAVLNTVAALVAWYKNNSLTDEAKKGDEVTREEKEKKKSLKAANKIAKKKGR